MSSTTPEPLVHVDHDGEWLVATWCDTSVRLPAVWLRDNAPSGRHRDAGQRTFDITALPDPIVITAAEAIGDSVRVAFGDGMVDVFPFGTLLRRRTEPRTRLRWDRSLQDRLVGHRWQAVTADPAARLSWCRDLRDLGVALLRGTPTDRDAVVTVTELFGFVRHTNYGITFDVRVEPDPSNLAFTAVEIGPHTDNPYRDPVPGIQLLHCLRNDSDGGLTRLTDGFAVVDELARHDPEAVRLLETHPVTFEFVDRPAAHLRARHPLIERDADGELSAIRFNSRSASPFDMDADLLPDFYEAYRTLGAAYADPRFRIELLLEPGDVIAFDNRRVLHGRSAFEGPRHLVGCYADHDSLESTIRVLEAELGPTPDPQ